MILMMFKKRLELIFLGVTLLFAGILLNNWYQSYLFDSNPISESYVQRIAEKKHEIMEKMRDAYGFTLDIPIIISDKLGQRRYGVTAYENGRIRIYLNKKVMRESMEYILDDVIAHEYAHALMFKQGVLGNADGHTQQWQNVCQTLGGSRCDRYVDHEDVIRGKMPF